MTNEEAFKQYLEHLSESTPYYDWLEMEVVEAEQGRVVARIPFTERTEAPEIAPDSIHGGVLTTAIDSVGMATVASEEMQLAPLATVSMDVTFHEGAKEDVLVEGTLVNGGSTLGTARVEVYPESEADEADPTLLASGETTARLFD